MYKGERGNNSKIMWMWNTLYCKKCGKKPDTSFYFITDFKPKVDETKTKATGKN